jgi:hypothetical protein
MSEAAEKPGYRPISDHDIEVLLASANAIKRLIDERNALRSRIDGLERELADLSNSTRLIVNNYRNLATKFLSQFQVMDSEVSSLFGRSESGEARVPEQPADAADPGIPTSSA